MPRVTTEGTVTIPEKIREELGIVPGDEVTFKRTETGYVVECAPTTADGADPFERYRGVADGTTEETMRQLRGEYPRGCDADDGAADGQS